MPDRFPPLEGVFDVVFCQFGFQDFPDRQQASREMFRALRFHGRLLASVWRALAHSPGFAAMVTALERHVSAEAGAVLKRPSCSGMRLRNSGPCSPEAGFRTVRIRPRCSNGPLRLFRSLRPAIKSQGHLWLAMSLRKTEGRRGGSGARVERSDAGVSMMRAWLFRSKVIL